MVRSCGEMLVRVLEERDCAMKIFRRCLYSEDAVVMAVREGVFLLIAVYSVEMEARVVISSINNAFTTKINSCLSRGRI